jgi:hypothetical protein
MLENCNCEGNDPNCYWCWGMGRVVNHYFPWADVDNCPVIPTDNMDKDMLIYSRSCPQCGKSPEKLTWIDFSSPPWTWKHLCGRAGLLSVCRDCHIQVDFICESMN